MRGRVRRAALICAAGLVAALGCSLVQASPASAAPKPHMPTDKQIADAKAEVKSQAAAVGRLAAEAADLDSRIQRLQDLAELAMEQYNKAQSDLAKASQDQQRTYAATIVAQRRVDAARAKARQFVRSSYMGGSTVGAYGSLLTAGSPTEFLQQAAYLRYASGHQLDALGELDRAKVLQANAMSAARAAVNTRKSAAATATRAQLQAGQRVSDAQSQMTALRVKKSAVEQQLTAARIASNGLTAERARYDDWKKKKEAAARAEKARQEALKRKAAAEAAARRRAAQQAGSGGGDSIERALAPGGGWTAAKGQYVAQAALRWLGTPYAWGGGDANGPTYGVNGPGGGYRDGSVYGFDCSGLALWGWAQAGVYLSHYSGYQYSSGSYHPSAGNLLPGDLVFWSYDGTVGGIHHVAIYLGGGQVVQAPQSGDVVRVSSMWYAGYFGAVRPGT